MFCIYISEAFTFIKVLILSFIYGICQYGEFWLHPQEIFYNYNKFLFHARRDKTVNFIVMFTSHNDFTFKVSFMLAACHFEMIKNRRWKWSLFDVEILSLLKTEIWVEADIEHWFSSFVVPIPNLRKTGSSSSWRLNTIKDKGSLFDIFWIINFFNINYDMNLKILFDYNHLFLLQHDLNELFNQNLAHFFLLELILELALLKQSVSSLGDWWLDDIHSSFDHRLFPSLLVV